MYKRTPSVTTYNQHKLWAFSAHTQSIAIACDRKNGEIIRYLISTISCQAVNMSARELGLSGLSSIAFHPMKNDNSFCFYRSCWGLSACSIGIYIVLSIFNFSEYSGKHRGRLEPDPKTRVLTTQGTTRLRLSYVALVMVLSPSAASCFFRGSKHYFDKKLFYFHGSKRYFHGSVFNFHGSKNSFHGSVYTSVSLNMNEIENISHGS